jgi:tRNA(Ile)-lysidine synthase
MSPLVPILDHFFRQRAPWEPGDRLIVAFSGGPDSSALLAALVPCARLFRGELLAVHLDHGCDDDSARRRAAAGAVAAWLGVPFRSERRAVAELRSPGESPEAAMRRIRYQFLEEVADQWGARWIATGHTRDDQAETVVLRLLAGSGLDGLAAIAPRRGRLVRPLLEVGRATVHAALPVGLAPVYDPGNEDLVVPRVAVRRRLLPRLEASEPGAGKALARLAERSRGARAVLDRRLLAVLEARDERRAVSFSAPAFTGLPRELVAAALSALARRAGFDLPPSRGGQAELLRQLVPAHSLEGTSPRTAARRVECHAGGALRVESAGAARLRLARVDRTGKRALASFSYTLTLPGEVEIPELGALLRIHRSPVSGWMFRGESARAALELPAGETVTVRCRRPGDRLRPLGAPGERKLKDVLIDHRVPRERRDRLPLVAIGERVVWVPGVTIDESCRVAPGSSSAWVVEVLPR